MIYSIELEKQVLSGMLSHPEVYGEIADFINDEDFYSGDNSIHRTIFQVVRSLIDSGDAVDPVVVAQRLKDLGINNTNGIPQYEYIRSLAYNDVPPEATVVSAKELKKTTIRRSIFNSAKEIEKRMVSIPHDSDFLDIVGEADRIFNKHVDVFNIGGNAPINLMDEMVRIIEERGENPVKEFGLMGPHKRLNEIYGSLLRPGNITVFVARAAVGKTTLTLDYITKVALESPDVPILHFDNGEMSEEELAIRQCAALSGLPTSLLETGQWRQAGDDVVKRVRAVWKKVKNLKFYYFNVGGLEADQMIAILKRFYYSQVGRGNKMIFSFDYIKTSFEKSNQAEWQIVGQMLDKFKRSIQRDIVVDGEPMVAMITSVQSNRYGIVGNKSSDDIVDDESIVSMSDRIIQLCSHMFILRKKTHDEIADEGGAFGTHKLINIKARHLGTDPKSAIDDVIVNGKAMKNFINFDFDNFYVKECGDAKDIAKAFEATVEFDTTVDTKVPSPKPKKQASKPKPKPKNETVGLPNFDEL